MLLYLHNPNGSLAFQMHRAYGNSSDKTSRGSQVLHPLGHSHYTWVLKLLPIQPPNFLWSLHHNKLEVPYKIKLNTKWDLLSKSTKYWKFQIINENLASYHLEGNITREDLK